LIVGMMALGETRHSCLLYVSPATAKFPATRRNTAEIRSMESNTKIGISSDQKAAKIDRRVSVAPMMDWTDRHCRFFLRGFSADVLLYTEMVTAAAVLRGDRARLLAFDPEEQPVALQLGGNEPAQLAAAAAAGEEAGYCEINLNCGCPSDRVASGAFGACLMREPTRVADCVAAMRARVRVPVTVKMRIGVVMRSAGQAAAKVADFGEEDFEALQSFVRAISSAGCERAIVHARKAVLGGLSPKENRSIPPLRYDVVRRVKSEFARLPIIVNGGFRDAPAVLDALSWCDGVMLGREAYHRPSVLMELHQALHPQATATPRTRRELLERMAHYAGQEIARGTRLSAVTRHMFGLFAGEPGAREFRRLLSHAAHVPGAGPELIREIASRCETATQPC
jgi:tRNA-dihydrouridine synthase A